VYAVFLLNIGNVMYHLLSVNLLILCPNGTTPKYTHRRSNSTKQSYRINAIQLIDNILSLSGDVGAHQDWFNDLGGDRRGDHGTSDEKQ